MAEGKRCELHQEADYLMELMRKEGKELRDEYSKIRVAQARLEARKEEIHHEEAILGEAIPELVAWKEKLVDMHEFVILAPDPTKSMRGDAQAVEVKLMGGCRARAGCAAAVAREEVPAVVQASRGVSTARVSLKRKNPGTQNRPGAAAKPPQKKIGKREHQKHADRPNYLCLVRGCTRIGKNDHIHRHLRSGLPGHGIPDDLHDSYMRKVEFGWDDRLRRVKAPKPIKKAKHRLPKVAVTLPTLPGKGPKVRLGR